MPLLLPKRRWSAWLAGGGEPTELLAPPAEEALAAIEIRPVGRGVGDVRNDGPGLVERVPAAPLGTLPNDHVDLTLF
jgi:putative SOS response-associated peptidase YedK